ncbi:hypothetical protein PO903_14785 [Paenibacillus sp. PK4536]|uniref:Uncharacterized protein n=1 Tax=Paenibacillus nuruki TaxID=1886670 RepID=A0A1E3L8U0_9BACL|nr:MULTISPECIES: hypothetical protein [Paenibacillus]ODP30168.1 hypothetical protein PTI45_00410 [Paenibacillus nuruki]TKJ91676.1 hypothetical protein PaeCFBP13512_10115 [Paenibacillus sp. CFBP13512]WIM37911.1 hypothetical protein PO903_14785 [Paenibacillus sp. PK4536]
MLTLNSSKELMMTLTDKELFFLGGILGFDQIMGIDNPFHHSTAEELADIWKQASTSLLQKGCLIIEDNNELASLPPDAYLQGKFIGTYKRGCCIRYFCATDANSKVREGHSYFTHETVVDIKQTPTLPGSYTLTELGSLNKACTLLLKRMKLSNNKIGEMPALTFSRQWFDQYFRDGEPIQLEKMISELTEMTGDSEGSRIFAKVLHNYSLRAEIQFSQWEEDSWQRQGAVLLADQNTNWIVRMSNQDHEDWVIAVPVDKKQLRRMLLDWVQQPDPV